MAPRTPRILRVQPGCENDAADVASDLMLSGSLVVIPTDTVYGVAAHPAIPAAVKRLYEAKGRDRDKPVPLLAADLEAVLNYGARLTQAERLVAEAYWPGPLTLVAAVGDGSEGFRVPDCEFARMLLRKCGGVLRVSSANLSGQPPALSGEDALRLLGDRVDAVLDSGPVGKGVPSTVVRLTPAGMVVIREGAIEPHEIERTAAGRRMN